MGGNRLDGPLSYGSEQKSGSMVGGLTPPPRENGPQQHAFAFFGFEAFLRKLSVEGAAGVKAEDRAGREDFRETLWQS